jgi:glycerol-3-phosphate dehydrogenase subunit C
VIAEQMPPVDAPKSRTSAAPRSPEAVLRTMDRCTKCGTCQAFCPVAAVTEAFPGPRYTGPQAQRFRVLGPIEEAAPELCSGCGICASVCPNDVAIPDIITLARADMTARRGRPPLGRRLLARPDTIGHAAALAPWLANAVLGSTTMRRVAARLLDLHEAAPLPRARGRAFRRWLARHEQPEGESVAYFSGCAVEYYDPGPGIAAVQVLNRLGHRVEVPTDACCGLPMLSCGDWTPARARAGRLVHDLTAASEGKRPVVATSTSCALAVRDKYAAYLGLEVGLLATTVTDVCALLLDRHEAALGSLLGPMALRVLYHGPCQQRAHRTGLPAVELLRLVPELDLSLSAASCCGVAGTYGYAVATHPIAMAVGRDLFDQVAAARPDIVSCDSETCRWHIERATGVPCRHPVEVLAAALDGKDPRV